MDRSHNCARLLFGLPSLSLFVLTDFPVCLINKRQSRAGQGLIVLVVPRKREVLDASKNQLQDSKL